MNKKQLQKIIDKYNDEITEFQVQYEEHEFVSLHENVPQAYSAFYWVNKHIFEQAHKENSHLSNNDIIAIAKDNLRSKVELIGPKFCKIVFADGSKLTVDLTDTKEVISVCSQSETTVKEKITKSENTLYQTNPKWHKNYQLCDAIRYTLDKNQWEKIKNFFERELDPNCCWYQEALREFRDQQEEDYPEIFNNPKVEFDNYGYAKTV